ncbi:hypothetical protein CSUB01_09991 [Colletotrichum sublineola]|uniref:Uncharacterized protein n=1 Tax=Colletotrichum sublineola TaxID=1173701 RepID=A0A066X9G8_COLSU|nr:hypothetical protein CSUB01_09991 [Colletotrichum sublineola]
MSSEAEMIENRGNAATATQTGKPVSQADTRDIEDDGPDKKKARITPANPDSTVGDDATPQAKRKTTPRVKPDIVHIDLQLFRPTDDHPWQFPTDTLSRLRPRHITALRHAVVIFNHDIENVVYTAEEKLYGSYTTTINLLQHLCVHDSSNTHYDDELDQMLTALERVRRQPRKVPQGSQQTQAVQQKVEVLQQQLQEATDAKQKARALQQKVADLEQQIQKSADEAAATKAQARDNMTENIANISKDNYKLFEFVKCLEVNDTMANKYLVQGVAAEFRSRKWTDLAKYAEKITDLSIDYSERQVILDNAIREVVARLTGHGNTMMPKHYTPDCECGKNNAI